MNEVRPGTLMRCKAVINVWNEPPTSTWHVDQFRRLVGVLHADDLVLIVATSYEYVLVMVSSGFIGWTHQSYVTVKL